MRIIDLSALIAPSPPDAAPASRVEIQRTSHAEGAAQIQALLHVPPGMLRDGEGWAVEEFTRLGTHGVTHVDAPWHYNSTIQGRKAATIDELPLEWFFADGVVLDMTHKADGERVDVRDVEAALATISYALKPLDIILVRTGRDGFLPYSQIERLVNLGALPPVGFKVACFPLKILAGSAGPTRAVAILPE